MSSGESAVRAPYLAAAASVGALGGAICTWYLLGGKPRFRHSTASEAIDGGTTVAEDHVADQAILAVDVAREGRSKGASVAKTSGGTRDPPGKLPADGEARAAAARRSSTARDVTCGMRRDVFCEDALLWLSRQGAISPHAFVFTSLPDVVEVKDFAPTVSEWRTWFISAVKSVLQALPAGGIAVFYQTDIRLPGVGQISKAHLVLQAAAELGDDFVLWWHKVVHFGSVDNPAYTSVQFTHLLCFGRRGGSCASAGASDVDEALDLGTAIPDLLARGPKPTWLRNSARCTGTNAIRAVVRWVSKQLPHVDTVVDPFCGAGTVLAVGNALGLHAVGVDLSPRRAKQAKALDGAELLAMPIRPTAEGPVAGRRP